MRLNSKKYTDTKVAKTHISKEELFAFIKAALHEDVGDGDHTSLACIRDDSRSKAKLLVKDAGILAGLEFASHVFEYLDPSYQIEFFKNEGDDVIYGDIAFIVECNTRSLLQAERLILNTMQRMSGIATICSQFSFEVSDTKVKILDTRKTTPLFRMLEKWAVRIGGCHNYRDGLYDRFMPKDNHVDACGSISNAILKINDYKKINHINLPITIEVRNLVELYEVLEIGMVDRIMLDNFELPLLYEAVAIVDGKFELEASGGITLNNVGQFAKTGVDYISVGALTHSAHCLDLSLKIIK
ncbi:MAG: carboxylating nicotinate-nucleotide diphosphorylase [Saprospiraceae bacterium]